MREVSALVEAHAHDGVAGLEDGEVRRHVRLRAGVRLDVGMLGAEDVLRPRDREVLDLVDDLAALVVAPTRVPLRVLVGEDGPGGLHHRVADEVLGGDQLDVRPLALRVLGDQRGERGVGLCEAHHVRHWGSWRCNGGRI